MNADIPDPFEDVDFEPMPDAPITEAATVVKVGRHPVYGTVYTVRGWFMTTPWRVSRRSSVTVHRGNMHDAPTIGHAGLFRLRRNGIDVKEVMVGMVEPEVLFDVYLDAELPIEVGDTVTFEAS